MGEDGSSARLAVEFAARASYGRLLAILASRDGDVAAAEDALSDAFLAALARWPETGVPANPDAWLLTVARRRATDEVRRAQTRSGAEPLLLSAARLLDAAPGCGIPDRRLALLFACAHPAIDPAVRTPLMLQAVLGLDAARVAAAFLASPATMAQRLVRAKQKIRDARIPLELPEADELAPRLDAVLQAVYAAYGTAWDDLAGAEAGHGLAEEALWLGRMIAEQLPDEPEARGLLALMLLCESRREARRAPDGGYVPLSHQDQSRWSESFLAQAEQELAQAARARRPGRFQLEAAIQSAHVARIRGHADWSVIVRLYDALVRHAPTVGAWVARAAALAEASGPAAGLTALDELPAEAVRDYQPHWALRARLMARLGRRDAATEAYGRAIGLTEDAAVRTFLAAERDAGR